jgi:2-polyprenyl-6-methoxyphenol hydroxylase-like FAD-dependent oxidoreductase
MSNLRYDVVIVGAGPAGLMLSTCLARWRYSTKHIDNRPEPTRTGRADGIQPRSLDLLRNMGLKRAIMAKDPARVYEVAFWDPESGTANKSNGLRQDGSEARSGIGKDVDQERDRYGRGIVRTGTAASCPRFIDARYPFTTLLHQGHIEQIFLEDMAKNNVEVLRPWHITDFANDGKDPVYPVRVEISHVNGRSSLSVRAKYLYGAEGAKSFIRQRLQIPIHYKDPIAHVWGVMDGVVKTDFPDIKVNNRDSETNESS